MPDGHMQDYISKYVSEAKEGYSNMFTNTTVLLEPGEKVAKDKQEIHTGGSASYYRVFIEDPETEGQAPYWAECIDIIEALEMNYNEANAFKAIWRTAASRTLGLKKKGLNDLYDAEKVVFFGNRMVKKAKRG